MNKKREIKEAEPAERSSGVARSVVDLVNGNFLVKGEVTRHIPYFLFLTLIALIYIGNGYFAEDSVRELNRIKGQMKELRSEYISTKSQLMFGSKQSEVARLMEPYGISESVVPPNKLLMPKEKND